MSEVFSVFLCTVSHNTQSHATAAELPGEATQMFDSGLVLGNFHKFQCKLHNTIKAVEVCS